MPTPRLALSTAPGPLATPAPNILSGTGLSLLPALGSGRPDLDTRRTLTSWTPARGLLGPVPILKAPSRVSPSGSRGQVATSRARDALTATTTPCPQPQFPQAQETLSRGWVCSAAKGAEGEFTPTASRPRSDSAARGSRLSWRHSPECWGPGTLPSCSPREPGL